MGTGQMTQPTVSRWGSKWTRGKRGAPAPHGACIWEQSPNKFRSKNIIT